MDTAKKKPKVLLATTCRWISTARLGMALREAGCEVEAVCPPGHPLIATQTFAKTYWYSGFRPLGSFSRALERSEADFVVPCDELSMLHLHRMHANVLGASDGTTTDIHEVIEHSIGDPSHYSCIESRSEFLSVAEQEGIRIPATRLLASESDLDAWLSDQTLPVVLKADGTSGGEGVQIVFTREQAARAFRSLHAPLASAVVLKRTIVDRDFNFVVPWLQRKKRNVSVQSVIKGSDANIAFLAWRGEVLASISVEVLHTSRRKGPATVIRRINEPLLLSAARKIATRLGLSGLFGLDFVIEEGTGIPYLIEINARATQTCHLHFEQQQDICGALYSALSGQPRMAFASAIAGDTVALFPAAWQADPRSEALRTAYHDVPWEEPSLVRDGVAPASKINYENWLALKARLRGSREDSNGDKREI